MLLVACASAAAKGGATATDTGGRPDRVPDGANVYQGFQVETFTTEPLALLPAVRISLPAELEGGSGGEALRADLERLILDRLPEEVRIARSRGPVYKFREWAGAEEAGPRSGFLKSVLTWEGNPGPAGELPELVGNSVEELGDSRGIRYFLFPRSLTVLKRGAFDYAATIEGFLLDARGERVVWAGTGQAVGTLPEDDPDQILTGVVRDAATRAVADLAARLPGARSAGTEGDFSDVDY
jgi:hypothetical protein